MVVVAALLTLHLPGVQSLKDKRAIVRSLVERLRVRRQVSAAEVGLQDRLQGAQVGFAVVSRDFATARGVADELRRYVDDELIGKGEVVRADLEELSIEG
ncbi:MAG: DUF503 domain-containing protein [Dehalococcoidia bacterium]